MIELCLYFTGFVIVVYAIKKYIKYRKCKKNIEKNNGLIKSFM